ncbi:hypothetical protein ACFL2D_02425 [Patescibacteria group bacterium]
MKTKILFLAVLVVAIVLTGLGCSKAEIVPKEYQGINFPLGDLSFADEVVEFEIASNVDGEYRNDSRITNPPQDEDFSLGNAADECQYYVTIKFTDNYLIDVEGDDLYIFENGPQVEATQVFISEKGNDWIDLGRIEGSTREVDIKDKADEGTKYRYVKLCDYPDGDTSPAPFPGPDLDAVGAIGADTRCETIWDCAIDSVSDLF